jgi:iron complex outermembrane recepter protein
MKIADRKMTPPASLKSSLFKTTLLSSLALAGVVAAPALARAADNGVLSQAAADVANGHAVDAAAASPAVDTAAASSTVVVTARRQNERAQDVPIALTALPKKVLDQTRAYTLADVQNLVPDLVAYQTNARNSSIGIRGVGVSSASDGLDTTVGVYVDGVYLGRPGMALEDLIDTDQVEVLNGPQGTLFGRNSAAGVVNITTLKPSFTPGAVIEGSYGNYNYNQIRASLTGPLFGDVIAARLTAFETHRDGVLPNTFNNTSDNSIGRGGARLQFLITPTPKLSIRLIGDYSVEDDTCCVNVFKSIVSPSLVNAASQDTLKAFAQLGYVPVASTNYTQINAPQDMLTDQHSFSGEIDYDLGWADLTSISAYRYWHFHPLQDSDAIPLDIIQVNVAQTKDNQYTQEFRLASKPGRFTWQVGAFLFDQDLKDHYILNQFGYDAGSFYTYYNHFKNGTPLSPGTVIAPGSQYNSNTTDTQASAAVFGQGNFKITDQLILTAGVRETYDTQHGVTFAGDCTGAGLCHGRVFSLNVGTPYATSSVPFYDNATVSGTNTSYLVSLSYKITPDIMTYVSYSTGYQAAGINLNAAAPAGQSVVLAPEQVTDVEGGVKSSLFNHQLVLNLDVFRETISGLQANIHLPSVSGSFLANVGNILSEGVEGQIDWSVTDGFTISGNAAYDDAYYTSYPDAPPPNGAPSSVTGQSLTGKPVFQAPRWTVSAIARYDWTVRDDIRPYVQAQYTYRSSVFGDPQDSPGAVIPGYSLVNATIGAKFGEGGRYDASLWIQNAFNAVYFNTLGGASIPSAGTFGFDGELGPPRTFGATLRARF